MPPLYDNIADAFVLTQDGVQHTHDFDNTGATVEGNESTYGEGWPGVWAFFDLTDYIPDVEDFISFTFQLEKISGTVVPYADFYGVQDETFDPSSPDFSKLSFISGIFVGDGTDTPPPKTFTRGDFYFGPTSPYHKIYIFLTDWSFTPGNEGVQRLTYTINPAAFPAFPRLYVATGISGGGGGPGTPTKLAILEDDGSGGNNAKNVGFVGRIVTFGGMAYRQSNGKLYGVTSQSDNVPNQLVTIDPETAELSLIGDLDPNWVNYSVFTNTSDIDFWDDVLYAAIYANDTGFNDGTFNLYTIDLTTGAATLIGNFGLAQGSGGTPLSQYPAAGAAGLAFDLSGNLWLGCNLPLGNPRLYSVNKLTGAATLSVDPMIYPASTDGIQDGWSCGLDGKIYTLMEDDFSNSSQHLGLFDTADGIITEITVDWTGFSDRGSIAWANEAPPSVISILHYFQESSWHQSGSEVNRDLYYYKDGAWHKKGTESIQTIKARYSGAWVD